MFLGTGRDNVTPREGRRICGCNVMKLFSSIQVGYELLPMQMDMGHERIYIYSVCIPKYNIYNTNIYNVRVDLFNDLLQGA